MNCREFPTTFAFFKISFTKSSDADDLLRLPIDIFKKKNTLCMILNTEMLFLKVGYIGVVIGKTR